VGVVRSCINGIVLLISIAAYMLTRIWSTMDHLTNGRVGWNIVTSYSTLAAKAFGHDTVVPRDKRYAAVEEYVKLCYW
jgi:alkanesulfonate monooxygenase SsuD/methylene tetrahydromethanopterin reductase-like flavin-dependent oxidoreductase (luciferase family)